MAGLTIAHGVQYLLLLTLLAAGPGCDRSPALSVLVLTNIASVFGLALSYASHQHTASGPARTIFGVYLGLSTAHFVMDAGMRQLQDEFPPAFLTDRLPYLLAVPAMAGPRR